MAERLHDVHIHPGHDLIAVFPTRDAADEAERELAMSGIAGDEVVIGDEHDRAVVLAAEMATELGTGPLTWRTLVRRHGDLPSVLVLGAVGWAVTLIIAVPVAMIPFGPDHYWQRYVIVAAVMLSMASMVAVLAIGAIATGHHDEPLPSESGVPLHVHHATDEACRTLLAMHPLRIDEVSSSGRPVAGLHLVRGVSVSPPGRHDSGW